MSRILSRCRCRSVAAAFALAIGLLVGAGEFKLQADIQVVDKEPRDERVEKIRADLDSIFAKLRESLDAGQPDLDQVEKLLAEGIAQVTGLLGDKADIARIAKEIERISGTILQEVRAGRHNGGERPTLRLARIVPWMTLTQDLPVARSNDIAKAIRDNLTSIVWDLQGSVASQDLGRAAASIKELERWESLENSLTGLEDATKAIPYKMAKWRANGNYAAAIGENDRAEKLYLDALALVRDRKPADLRDFNDELAASVKELVDFYLSKRRDLQAAQFYHKLSLAVDKIALPPAVKNILVDRSDTIYSLVPRFVTADAAPAQCNALGNDAAVTRALLIGNEFVAGSREKLKGPANDVRLLEKSLQVRGAANIRTTINATRSVMITEMQRLANDVRCGDFVLFYYSGYAFDQSLPLGDLSIPVGWEGGLVPIDHKPDAGDWATAVWNADISEFVVALRNRGANVLLFMDGGRHAAAIRTLQIRAGAANQWSGLLEKSSKSNNWNVVTKDASSGVTPLAATAGAYAVFDPSTEQGSSGEEHEWDDGGGQKQHYGLLTYALARVLQTQAQPTVRETAEGIAHEFTTMKRATGTTFGTVAASDPNMVFLAPAGPLRTDGLDVEVLSPKLKEARGALFVEQPTFELVGRVAGAASISLLTLNHRPLQLDPNGQFKTKVELVAGQNQITFAAFGRDYRFRTKTVEFTYDGDLNRMAAVGERYALVIGIKNYVTWTSLATPHADAKAVAEALRQTYGFRTEIDLANGQKRSLLLLDAKLQDITSALTLLRQRLTENDSLLIYYAGHGKWLQDNQVAYWVPRDGDLDDQFTWLSARQLTSELKRMNVRSVLVVSDSCFSGAMTRDAPDLSAWGEDRRRALLKAGNKKSRIFIASGGTEPVLDKGCPESAEHSVFACAFLQALKEMKEPVFSSGELHHMYVLPRVSGRAQQQPERKELSDSGHDNGEFIFARVEAQAAGRQVEERAAKQ